MTAVLDASAAVAMLVDADLAPQVRRAVRGRRLFAPAIIDLEVCSALARRERGGLLRKAQAETALARWLALPVERVELQALVAAAFAKRFNLRIADAFYVALAESLNMPLLTTDLHLKRAPLLGVGTVLID